MLARVRRWTQLVTEGLALVVLVSTLILLTLQVLSRLIRIPIPVSWIQELVMFGLVWMAFLGATLAFGQRAHIAIDFLTQRLPERMRRWVARAVQAVTLAFFAVLAASGISLSLTAWAGRSAAIGVPLGAVFLVVPVSSLAILIIVGADLVEGLTRPDGATAPEGPAEDRGPSPDRDSGAS